MSSMIVVEALGLVTWWGMGRIVQGLRRDRRSSGSLASRAGSGSNDSMRSA
jgi:hypothetical protein